MGLYRAVGFGVLGDPAIDVLDAIRLFDISLIGWKDVIRCGAECHPQYAVLLCGVDDPDLQQQWGVSGVPAGAPSVKHRTAEYIERPTFLVPKRVQRLWEIFSQQVATVSILLPPGRVVVLSDFD